MIRRGRLVSLVLTSGFVIATFTYCVGIILTAIFTEPPDALVVGFLVLVALRVLASLFATVSFYVRRSRRRRRIPR